MKRVLVNEPVCMGCRLCEVFCQLQHSKSKDLIRMRKNESPAPLARVHVEAKKPAFFSLRCQHCSEPTCVYSCLTGALSKDPVTGVVKIDEDKCIGCWTCILACPYGAISQDIASHKSIKCDMCEGEEVPACVANCPNEALVVVDIPDDVAVGGGK